MDWSNVDFCGCDERVRPSDIVDLLVGKGKVFPESLRDTFEERYAKMHNNFQIKMLRGCGNRVAIIPGRESLWDQGDFKIVAPIVEERDEHGGVIKRKTVYKDALLAIPQEKLKFEGDDDEADFWIKEDNGVLSYPCVGHDLPTWMKRKNGGNGKRIMIISQDPLRTGHGAGQLLISSPFGFHSADYRSNSTMMKFVHELVVDCGYEVYLTDLMKLYNRDPQPLDVDGKSPCKGCVNYERCIRDKKRIRQGKDLIREKLCAKYTTCIEKEINEYGPMLVILLGNEVISQSSFFSDVQPPSCGISVQNGLSINKPIMSLYHPALKFPDPIRRVVGGIGKGVKARYFSKVCEEIMRL